MIMEDRLDAIEELTNERGFVSTRELASRFSVSEPTIRTDCRELEKQQRILRVHGGAKSRKARSIMTRKSESEMTSRANKDTEQKGRLCEYAASLVEDDDCIFVDGGTTFRDLVKYLEGKKVRMVTHSLIIPETFGDENGELFVAGGSFSPKYRMNLGPVALDDLERFNFKYAFLSCAGIDAVRGKAYTAEMETAEVKKKAMRLAEQSFLLVDESKKNVKGFCSFADLNEFDGIVTFGSDDSDLPDNFILLEA